MGMLSQLCYPNFSRNNFIINRWECQERRPRLKNRKTTETQKKKSWRLNSTGPRSTESSKTILTLNASLSTFRVRVSLCSDTVSRRLGSGIITWLAHTNRHGGWRLGHLLDWLLHRARYSHSHALPPKDQPLSWYLHHCTQKPPWFRSHGDA